MPRWRGERRDELVRPHFGPAIQLTGREPDNRPLIGLFATNRRCANYGVDAPDQLDVDEGRTGKFPKS